MARSFSVTGSVFGVGLACVVALTLGGLSACKNQAPPAPEATATEPTPPAPTAASAAAAVPAPAAASDSGAAPSKYSEAPFDVVIQPKGTYASGQAGAAEIVISAKAPFHANDKYPYKFKLNETPGVKFANLVIDKDAVKVEKTTATLSVALTPESAGKHTVSGKLFFSVCNEDQCLVEKRDLALAIDAK